MKLTLISPMPDITAFGIRSISAYLREKGENTRLIFLPDLQFWQKEPSPYPDSTLEQVAELCRDSDLIGISFITYFFERAVQLTKRLKEELDVPIVWGGKHPTARPEEALHYADMVCLGEGEEAIYELLQRMEAGKEYRGVRNFWSRGDGTIVKNPLRPLVQDLNSIAPFDYSMENHYVWEKEEDRIVPMDISRMEKFTYEDIYLRLGKMYLTMTTRGCPHQCSYCATFRGIYPGQKYLRMRSMRRVIQECREVKEKFPFIRTIHICDDCFLSRPLRDIQEFSQLYKEEVGLDLICLGHPSAVSEEKIDSLVDAGLRIIQVGVETASERTKKLYRRHVSDERVLKTARTINRFKDRLLPLYDFITDNPYETADDLRQTIRFMLGFPRPYVLQLFSLTFYPGTELYRKAQQDGFISTVEEENYGKSYSDYQKTYLNYLFLLASRPLPVWLIKLLLGRFLVSLFESRIGRTFFRWVAVPGRKILSLFRFRP